MGCTLFQRILALWERFEKAVENERFKVLHVFLALYEPNFRKAREGFLWSPGYRLCLSFQLITTTDGKKVSAACPHHWGRGACWRAHFILPVQMRKMVADLVQTWMVSVHMCVANPGPQCCQSPVSSYFPLLQVAHRKTTTTSATWFQRSKTPVLNIFLADCTSNVLNMFLQMGSMEH